MEGGLVVSWMKNFNFFFEIEKQLLLPVYGIVLEYVLDSYRRTDWYVLSNVDTKWNREKFRIRCGTNYLKKVE